MSKTVTPAESTTTHSSTEPAFAPGTRVLQLFPHELILDEHTNVRPWENNSAEDEQEAIKNLAKTIREEGQIQNALAREITSPTGSITYHLIAGRRRRAAIDLISREDVAKGKQPSKLNVTILTDVSDDSAFRKAMIENGQRLQMSPMDVALNIQTIIKRMGWADKKDWSKRVADFLGTSRAYVTQKLKMFDLDPAIQSQVASGELSERAALLAASVKPEHRKDVLDRAAEIAAAEPKPAADSPAPAVSATPSADGSSEETPALETGTVTEAHVLEAARETPEVMEKIIPLSRKEILAALEQFDGPAYGNKQGSVRKFIAYFVDTFAKGTGTPTMFKRLFNKMTEGIDPGPADPEPEVKAKPVAKGKAVAKAPAKGKKAAPKAAADSPAPPQAADPLPEATPDEVTA